MHNINEDKMFYYGETPWHGIGTKLNNPATSEEAIKAAKLNYQIELQSLYTPNKILVSNKKAAVRLDTKMPLGIVTDSYKIIQNTEAFSFFDSVVGEKKAMYHTAGALGLGEKIWILAKLPDDIIIAKKENVEKYLVLTNSHDGTTALRMYFTPVRVVCQNTLILSLRDAKDGISIRHVGSISKKIEEAQRVLGIAKKFYDDFSMISQKMADRKMTPEEVERYFHLIVFEGRPETGNSHVLKNRIDNLTQLFEVGKGNDVAGVRGSVWAALNSVTEYIDHYRKIKNEEDDKTNRMKSLFFGNGAIIKRRAHEAALQLIGIKN